MKRFARLACILALVLAPQAVRAEEMIAHGRFAKVRFYKPQGAPRRFVLLLSGAEGWTAANAREAALLVKQGAMVAGVDTPAFQARLGPNEAPPPGDLENLSHYLQGYARLNTYRTPVLAAAPSSLAFTRAMVARAPKGVYGALIPAEDPRQLMAAYGKLSTVRIPALPPPPASLAGLPLVEVRASGPAVTPAAHGTFAIMLSGDGGWAGLDQQVAATLSARGVPVVGLDSLRYFWRERTPKGLAGDLDRVIRYYAAHWKRGRVLLIGYSQGADVLPAAINRLPPAARARVAQTALIGLGHKASWQFHLSNWIGPPGGDAQPIAPEAARLSAADTLCLSGEGDRDSLCPELPSGSVTAEPMPGGHHFNGAYEALAARILARLD